MFALTTAAFPQCFEVLSGTRIQLETNKTYTLIINYKNTGSKALDMIVKCDNSVIKTDCLINNGNGTQTYHGLVCQSGIYQLFSLLMKDPVVQTYVTIHKLYMVLLVHPNL